MATGPAFDDAVGHAKATPTLGVGCHLVLTGGTAVAPPSEIPSLVGANGLLPESLGIFALTKVTSGSIRTSDIETELRAQIQKILSAGIEPTHVDTHKHTHVHPVVMNVLGRVLHEFGITHVRNPVENLQDSWRTTRSESENASPMAGLAAAVTVKAVASQFQTISRKYGLHSPDRFLGLAITGQLGTAALCRLIDTLPEGQSEIMLHPGICDADLARTGSRLQQHRQIEMEGLMAPEVRHAIEKNGIRLISFRDLH